GRAATASRCVTHPGLGFGCHQRVSGPRGTCCACRHMVRPDFWRVTLTELHPTRGAVPVARCASPALALDLTAHAQRPPGSQAGRPVGRTARSEEHTSELQSP